MSRISPPNGNGSMACWKPLKWQRNSMRSKNPRIAGIKSHEDCRQRVLSTQVVSTYPWKFDRFDDTEKLHNVQDCSKTNQVFYKKWNIFMMHSRSFESLLIDAKLPL